MSRQTRGSLGWSGPDKRTSRQTRTSAARTPAEGRAVGEEGRSRSSNREIGLASLGSSGKLSIDFFGRSKLGIRHCCIPVYRGHSSNVMVEGDRQGKPQEGQRSSVSPTRDRGRQKPRQEWLVAVGRGLSPASTRKMEAGSSSNSPAGRKKKFDVDSLSFTGLERQVGHSWDKSSLRLRTYYCCCVDIEYLLTTGCVCLLLLCLSVFLLHVHVL